MSLPEPTDNPAAISPWFHAQSFMNARIGTLRRPDSQSAGVVAKLVGWVHGLPQSLGANSFTPGKPWVNASVCVYPADYTRRQKVTLSTTWWLQPAQQPYLLNVPVPDSAVGDATDRNLAIVDPAKGSVWEFYKFSRNETTGALTAAAAGWFTAQRQRMGVYDQTCSPPHSAILLGGKWGPRASGFSLLAGLTTIQELLDGCIPHATAGVVPWARQDWFSSPAQRTDGKDATLTGVPYGARFMLDPAFDADAYEASRRAQGWDGATPEPSFTLGRFARIVVNAWKAFGHVFVDQTGSGVGLLVESPGSCVARTGGVCGPFYGSDGRPGGPDDLYDAQPDQIMRQLPWEKLVMMPCDLRRAT